MAVKNSLIGTLKKKHPKVSWELRSWGALGVEGKCTIRVIGCNNEGEITYKAKITHEDVRFDAITEYSYPSPTQAVIWARHVFNRHIKGIRDTVTLALEGQES